MKTPTESAARTGQAAHTPTPWAFDENGYLHVSGHRFQCVPYASPWTEDAFDAHPKALANAAFIVRACNSYDANQRTITALTEALKLVAKHADFSQCPPEVEEAVDAVLAQVKKEAQP